MSLLASITGSHSGGTVVVQHLWAAFTGGAPSRSLRPGLLAHCCSCVTVGTPCSSGSAFQQQQRAAAYSTSASSSSLSATSTGDSSSQNSSKSSLRSDLGSGAALGNVQPTGQQQQGDTTAQRQSLLVDGKRFYDTVQVQPCPAEQLAGQPSSSSSTSSPATGYQLLLRKYPVKTPAKNVLVLPTLSLALAVAAEWEWLPSGKPAAHRMPLTGLACSAIDQPKEAAKVIEHLLKYVYTDGACIRCVFVCAQCGCCLHVDGCVFASGCCGSYITQNTSSCKLEGQRWYRFEQCKCNEAPPEAAALPGRALKHNIASLVLTSPTPASFCAFLQVRGRAVGAAAAACV